jgi:cytoskeletal protein CcmA (bactofilin family)
VALLAALAFAFAPMTVGAVEHRSGDRVVIAANETVEDDLIVTGDTIIIEGRVLGDVVATGQTIEVNGTIEGDLLAAGGGVTIAGTVADDARIAAAAVRLTSTARIGDDLLVGGASLEALPSSAVEGALMFGGGQALLAGVVGENVAFGGEGLELRGMVGGDVDAAVAPPGSPGWASQMRIEGAPPAPAVGSGLTLDRGARIGGDLAYTSRQRATIPEGIVGGAVRFTEEAADTTSAPTPQAPQSWFFELLRRYAALLLVGVLLIWLAPRAARDVTSELEAKPLASLGWGAISILALGIAFLAVPLATILMAVLLGSVSLNGLMGIVIATGILVLLALVVLAIIAISYVAQVAVSFEIGRLILLRVRPAWIERPIIPLAIGLVVLVALTAAPMVGWIFSLAAVLLGLGALWLFSRDTMQHRPIPAAAPA